MSNPGGPQFVEPEYDGTDGYTEVSAGQVPEYLVEPVRYEVDEVPPIAPPAAISSLRWLWWLLGALLLSALLWALVHRCEAERVGACTTLSEDVFNPTVQAAAMHSLEEYIPGVSETYHDAAVNALRELCNMRLSHHGYGQWYDNNAIQNVFSGIAPNLEPGAVTDIRNLVNGSTYCYCIH